MSDYTKVINDGEIWFLYEENGIHTEMVVVASGVYLVQNGSWEPGIEFKINGEVDVTPYFAFKELFGEGLLWKKGSERLAEFLRKKHAKKSA